jgi:hypothetical protein
MVFLQICMDLLEVVPGSCSEVSHNGNQIIDVKVEKVPVIQEEDDPVQITFPVIETEQDVCLCTLLGTLHEYTICILSYTSVCLCM